MMFDQIDRRIIREYKGSNWNKPLVITRYEVTKACRDLKREILKDLNQ